jgi:hypothetical protein
VFKTCARCGEGPQSRLIPAAILLLKPIGQLTGPRRVIDSHRVAAEVDVLAYRLDQCDIEESMPHAVPLTTDDAPAVPLPRDDESTTIGRIGGPLTHCLPSALMIDESVRIQTAERYGPPVQRCRNVSLSPPPCRTDRHPRTNRCESGCVFVT